MVDALKREISFSKELLEKSGFAGKIVKICYDPELKRLMLFENYESCNKLFFVESAVISDDGKITIPESIMNAFPGKTFLPAYRHGKLDLFIIG